MTTHVHDPSIDGDARPTGSAATDRAQSAPARPRWLLPALAAALVAAGLVVAGVIPLSATLYIAAFGGMLLMHSGGHGHGGRGAHGRGDELGSGGEPGSGGELGNGAPPSPPR